MASLWSVLSYQTTVGRPKQAKVLMWLTSTLTGKQNAPPAHRAKPARAFVRLGNEEKSFFPKRRVLFVRYAATARSLQPLVGSCMCVHRPLMRHCRHGDTN